MGAVACRDGRSSVPNSQFAISAATTGANLGLEKTFYNSSVVLVQNFS
jgi:hypothetical protein